MRKTGYLLAIWGKGSDLDIMKSARHKTTSNAIAYKRDASLILEISKSTEDFFEEAPTWKPIFMETLQVIRAQIDPIKNRFTSVSQLAVSFIEEKCGVNSDSLDVNITYLAQKMMDFSQGVSEKVAIESYLAANNIDKPELRRLIEKYCDSYSKTKSAEAVAEHVRNSILNSDRTRSHLIDLQTIQDHHTISDIENSTPPTDALENNVGTRAVLNDLESRKSLR
jgi:hypothetical protein